MNQITLLGRQKSLTCANARIVSLALNAEAISLYKQGHYDQAVVAEKKALQVAEQNLGPDHPDVATSLNSQAELYRASIEPKCPRAASLSAAVR